MGSKPFAGGTPASTRGPATFAELLGVFGEDGGVGYSSGSGGDSDGFVGDRRERIELACRSVGAGDDRIGVGEDASSTAVGKVNVVAGKGIAELIGHEHCERPRQLGSVRSGLIIAAANRDARGDLGNGVLGEGDLLSRTTLSCESGGDSHRGWR